MGILQRKDAARQWYRLVSPLYDTYVGETFWPAHLQRELLSAWELSEKRVLDVGCGTGTTTAVLAAAGAQVDAVDHSRPQLATANESVPAGRFILGDAEELPYDDGTFDAVVSVGAILYFPAPTTAMAEARRVTRPGGQILVAGFNRPATPSWNPVENWATLANETFYHTADREDAVALFKDTGWEGIETWVTGPAWHPRLARVTTATKPPR